MENLIRFDWAMKRLLRNKSNYVVLEGFLSTLLREDIHICRFLESESNQKDATDKFNRADILAEDSRGRFIIIEVQNNRELDYFHRMLYGVSKTVSEYINIGDAYDKVRKVYSINIVYFELGQGRDYVYHGKTEFRGIHNSDDILRLSLRQQEIFKGKYAGDIFPEYYVLKVNGFNKVAKTPLDEWIKFLKTGEIDDDATAKGLPEARERLRVDAMSVAEKQAYDRDMESLRYQKSVIQTGWIEGHAEGKAEGRAEGRVEGRAEGKAEGRAEATMELARKMKSLGMSIDAITECSGLSPDEIAKL